MRVLVVDDCDDNAMMLALLLRRYGHSTMVAAGGQAALQQVATFQPDVLFIDLGMPEVDGLTLARQLRQTVEFATTPLVAVTGYVDEAHRTEAFPAGFDDFLAKPYTVDELQDTLRRVQVRIESSRQQVAMSKDIAAQARRKNEEWRRGLR
jgi:CheY-like chemotaxis protein